MNRVAGRILLGCSLVMATGCDGLLPQNPQPTTITVTFINDSLDSGVSITFFNSADASASLDDLTNSTISEQLAFSLDANDSFPLVRACTDFQAAIIVPASVIVETGMGAMASTPVLVDGMDFVCGNFITFRLSSQGPDDLQIDVSIGDADPLAGATDAASGNGSAGDTTTGDGTAGDASGTTGETTPNKTKSNGTAK